MSSAVTPVEGEGPTELSPWQGPDFPPFELSLLDGTKFALRDHNGHVVVLNFFATWCAPCVAELASLSALAAAAKQSGVDVLAINFGEVEPRVRRFASSLPLTFPVALDRDKAVSKTWGVDMLPTSYVLDRNLAIRFAAIGEVDWTAPRVAAAIGALLGEPPPQPTRTSGSKPPFLR